MDIKLARKALLKSNSKPRKTTRRTAPKESALKKALVIAVQREEDKKNYASYLTRNKRRSAKMHAVINGGGGGGGASGTPDVADAIKTVYPRTSQNLRTYNLAVYTRGKNAKKVIQELEFVVQEYEAVLSEFESFGSISTRQKFFDLLGKQMRFMTLEERGKQLVMRIGQVADEFMDSMTNALGLRMCIDEAPYLFLDVADVESATCIENELVESINLTELARICSRTSIIFYYTGDAHKRLAFSAYELYQLRAAKSKTPKLESMMNRADDMRNACISKSREFLAEMKILMERLVHFEAETGKCISPLEYKHKITTQVKSSSSANQ